MKNTFIKLYKIKFFLQKSINNYYVLFVLLINLISPVIINAQNGILEKRIVNIEEKIYTAINGDTVQIEPGTYWGTLNFENLKNLTLDFTGVELLTKEDVTIFSLKNCSNIKIIGLTLRHDLMGCFTNCFDVNTCKNIRFTNCDINGSGFIGICINKSTNVKVENCKIHQCTVGIFLWEHNETYNGIPASTSDVTISNSFFEENEIGNICFDQNYADLIEFEVILNGKHFLVNPYNYKDKYLSNIYYIID